MITSYLDQNRILKALIEMGGGIGPVKPGNRVWQLQRQTVGAKSVRQAA